MARRRERRTEYKPGERNTWRKEADARTRQAAAAPELRTSGGVGTESAGESGAGRGGLEAGRRDALEDDAVADRGREEAMEPRLATLHWATCRRRSAWPGESPIGAKVPLRPSPTRHGPTRSGPSTRRQTMHLEADRRGTACVRSEGKTQL